MVIKPYRVHIPVIKPDNMCNAKSDRNDKRLAFVKRDFRVAKK